MSTTRRSRRLNLKPEPKPDSKPDSKPDRQPDDLDIALADLKKVREDKRKLNLKEIQDLRKKFKQTCDSTKRETQRLERERALAKPAGTTRSGIKRGVIRQAVYADGKWVNKGIDDAAEKLDDEEQEYCRKMIEKCKEVHELKLDYIRYLVVNVFFDELKLIQAGKVKSYFHDRYKELSGRSKMDLSSEVRTSLFTNEQRDYTNGLLQGVFETTTKDEKGDIKHAIINYIGIVMMAEATIRIVKYVHKLDTNEEAFAFMIRSSREACGLSNDD